VGRRQRQAAATAAAAEVAGAQRRQRQALAGRKPLLPSMSFANTVNFECGSLFIRYFDCTSRQERRAAAAGEQTRTPLPTAASGQDPCAKARTAMQVRCIPPPFVPNCAASENESHLGLVKWVNMLTRARPCSLVVQLCMLDIYVESVCSKPLHELSECAKEHKNSQHSQPNGNEGTSAPHPCEEFQRRFEHCTIAAVEGANADAAFQRFVEEGRTWKSPTKGRMSMMHVPGYQVESSLSSGLGG
jgi:hypothetical protein